MIVASDFVILASGSNPAPRTGVEVEDERLAAEGWVRRHTADANRVAEWLELYRSLGFEVFTRELTIADHDPQCRDCVISACTSYVLIYTRKSARQPDGESHNQRNPPID